MSEMSGHKFALPVVESNLSPEQREAIADRFVRAAGAAAANDTSRRPARPRRFNVGDSSLLNEIRIRRMLSRVKRNAAHEEDESN